MLEYFRDMLHYCEILKITSVDRYFLFYKIEDFELFALQLLLNQGSKIVQHREIF